MPSSEYNKIAMAQLHKQRLAAGLCAQCGVNKAETRYCDYCKEYRRSRRQTSYLERTKNGICVRCGKLSDPAHSYCESCRAMYREINRIRRHKPNANTETHADNP